MSKIPSRRRARARRRARQERRAPGPDPRARFGRAIAQDAFDGKFVPAARGLRPGQRPVQPRNWTKRILGGEALDAEATRGEQ